MSGAPSLRAFLKAMSQEKLKDIPAFLRSRVTAENIKTNFDLFSADYKKKYIDTGSFTPMVHTITGVFGIAYVLALPHERAHYEAQKHGGKHH